MDYGGLEWTGLDRADQPLRYTCPWTASGGSGVSDHDAKNSLEIRAHRNSRRVRLKLPSGVSAPLM